MGSQRTIAFVCLHGSAKSLIASKLAEQIARQRGLNLRFTSAGIEPDAEVPPHVVEGMLTDGENVKTVKPQQATKTTLSGTSLAVSFGPDLSSLVMPGIPVERWTDVPNVDAGYATARDAIRRKVEKLLERF